jgi:hypothetical protein
MKRNPLILVLMKLFMFSTVCIGFESQASGATRPGGSKAVAALKKLDPEVFVKDLSAQEQQELFMQRYMQNLRSRMGLAAENQELAELPTQPETPVDYEVFFELMSSKEAIPDLKLKLAQQIVTGPLSRGLPQIDEWPAPPEHRNRLKTSAEFEQAFWELPIDIISENRGRIDNASCNQMNFVMMWGLLAGMQRRFNTEPKRDLLRDDWARLIVSLHSGLYTHETLGRACAASLSFAGALWSNSLQIRSYNSSHSGWRKTWRVLDQSMIWYTGQKDPFVVELRWSAGPETATNFVPLGTLTRSPPNGNWYRGSAGRKTL